MPSLEPGGLHHRGIYLLPSRLPCSPSWRGENPQGRVEKSLPSQPLRPPSPFSLFPESEGDEAVPEADRDAYLA